MVTVRIIDEKGQDAGYSIPVYWGKEDWLTMGGSSILRHKCPKINLTDEIKALKQARANANETLANTEKEEEKTKLSQASRAFSLAITKLEEAEMWVAKAENIYQE